MLPRALRVPAARAHGEPGGGGGPGPLPLLRRGVVRHRPGLSHRRRSARHMKLIRFGPPGREKPGDSAARTGRATTSPASPRTTTRPSSRDGGLDRLAEWVGRNEKAIPRADAGARLGPPVPRPSKIVCIGLNYRDHAAETGAEIPKEPVIFFKSTTALVGPNDALVMPRGATKVDWEVELAIVIGARGALRRRGQGARARGRLRPAQRLLGAHLPARARRPVGEGQERGHVRAARPLPRHAGRDPRPAEPGHVAEGQRRRPPALEHREHGLRRPGPRQLPEPVHDAPARRRHQHGDARRAWGWA